MRKVQIEKNSLKMDDEDVARLVAIFAEHGIEAEPIEQEMSLKAAWWVLLVHVAEQNVEAYIESIPLQIIGANVVKHFKSRDRMPPRRIDIYGENDGTSTGDLDDE